LGLVGWLVLCYGAAAVGPRFVPAGMLFTPYLAWVTFAARLNFEIWRMNA